MSGFTKPFGVFFALAVYVAAGCIVELAHREADTFSLQPKALINSHNCGSHERHIPLDQVHPCLACMHASHRISADISGTNHFDPSTLCVGIVRPVDDRGTPFPHTSTDSRGPPALS